MRRQNKKYLPLIVEKAAKIEVLILEKGSVLKVRYLVKFSKESEIKFVSHLDLSKTIQRIVKRSGLPIKYSEGFNPHMSISIGQPLSVGMYSEGEYMDLEFTEKISEEYIMEKLNENVPRGIKILQVIFIPEKENVKNPPQAMAAVDEAEYEIRIKYHNTKNLGNKIEELLSRSQWNIVKRIKSGDKEVNIKTLIKSFEYSIITDFLFIRTSVSCGSKENLSAQLLSQYIALNTDDVDKEAFIDIKRKEMYAYKNKNRYPLHEFYKLLIPNP